jgi:hypothetical protein
MKITKTKKRPKLILPKTLQLPDLRHPKRFMEKRKPFVWEDRRVFDLFHDCLPKKPARIFRDVYVAMCELDIQPNNKRDEPQFVPGLYARIAEIAHMDEGVVGRTLRALRNVELIDYQKKKEGGKETWFAVYHFQGAEYYKPLFKAAGFEPPRPKIKINKLAPMLVPKDYVKLLTDMFERLIVGKTAEDEPIKWDLTDKSKIRKGAEKVLHFVRSGQWKRKGADIINATERDDFRTCAYAYIHYLKRTFKDGDAVSPGNLASNNNWRGFSADLKRQRGYGEEAYSETEGD